VAAELGVVSIPALVLFKDGLRIDQCGVNCSASTIKAMVEAAL
jgi:thioredoxin-like negative regulator of GroEL